jgi:hypothetical protein
VCELASVAFFAEAALVVLADQVVDAAAFRGRSVVSVMAQNASRAVAGLVLGAYRSCDLGWPAKSRV